MHEIIVKEIEDKNIIWFKNTNSYLVFEPVVAKIISKIDAKVPVSEIEYWCLKKLNAPKEVIIEFVNNIHVVYADNTISTENKAAKSVDFNIPTLYFSEKYYLINNFIFQIQFETEYHESKIHPAFAHLETEKSLGYNFVYTIFDNNQLITFLKEKKCIGQWCKEEVHLLQGKFSMQLLIDIYKKSEEEWMGTFHASAVSNGKESLLILGDSGNGKSTSLALLNANGYHSIADDFVPIDINKDIYTYPAAISLKAQSMVTLLPYYPELETSAEYHFKKMKKIVRYLSPIKIDYNQKQKCKALIFIKYNPDVDFQINLISQINALQQLIPDSWISPIKENAETFIDWFLELPCYQLTYSNNQKMIESVSKIFNDEL